MSEGRLGRDPEPQKLAGHYTQVNIMFPASEVELPPAEKYNAFPPEAQKAILLAFQREQMERHAWLRGQQQNEHGLNMNEQRFAFIAQVLGTGVGAAIVISMILCGTWLLLRGISAAGVAMIIAAISGLVGTAIYGHRAAKSPPRTPPRLETKTKPK